MLNANVNTNAVDTNTVYGKAMQIGQADRLTLTDTLALHTQYSIADDIERKTMRTDWFRGYLIGYTNHTAKIVESILSGGLSKARIDDDCGDGVYERCSKQFKYHVARDSAAKPAPAAKSSDHTPKAKAKAATAAEAAMVAALISVCGSRARALEVLNAAK